MRLIGSPTDGERIDATATMYPSALEVVRTECAVRTATSTTYGYVVAGKATLRAEGLDVRADAGTFFGLPGPFDVTVTDGAVVLIERHGFRGLPSLGRIEATGRLAYIDGCSDTVLVAPPRQGDPVLNHLHFPAAIEQSLHTHPSIRLGVVARGDGEAYGPGWTERLVEGAVFLLEPHEVHAFRTKTRPMDVIAFHPDSDWGPTDAAHPMLNRTYLSRPSR